MAVSTAKLVLQPFRREGRRSSVGDMANRTDGEAGTAIPLSGEQGLGAALRRLRCKAPGSPSQREVADRAGVDYGNLSRYESGENLWVETLGKILLALGCDLRHVAEEMGQAVPTEQLHALVVAVREEVRAGRLGAPEASVLDRKAQGVSVSSPHPVAPESPSTGRRS